MVRYVKSELPHAVCFAWRDAGESNGTDDCMKQAKAAGIPVYVTRRG
jgi:hypothetical protein